MSNLQAHIKELQKEQQMVRKNLIVAERNKDCGSRGEMNACYDALDFGNERLSAIEIELNALHNYVRAQNNLSRYHQAGHVGDEEMLNRMQHGDFS